MVSEGGTAERGVRLPSVAETCRRSDLDVIEGHAYSTSTDVLPMRSQSTDASARTLPQAQTLYWPLYPEKRCTAMVTCPVCENVLTDLDATVLVDRGEILSLLYHCSYCRCEFTVAVRVTVPSPLSPRIFEKVRNQPR